MRSTLFSAATAVVVAALWAFVAYPASAAAHSGGGVHGGVHQSGARGGLNHKGDEGRGRGGRRWGGFGAGGRYDVAQTGLAVGLAAGLAYGYADYYGDYEALPLVAPDYGYPSAFDNEQWPYSASANPYHLH